MDTQTSKKRRWTLQNVRYVAIVSTGFTVGILLLAPMIPTEMGIGAGVLLGTLIMVM